LVGLPAPHPLSPSLLSSAHGLGHLCLDLIEFINSLCLLFFFQIALPFPPSLVLRLLP
jgi:hypothetical protein